jgi:hypothetical protein
MPSKDTALGTRQRILDILENIAAVGMFTAGMDFPRFSSNLLVRCAVTRAPPCHPRQRALCASMIEEPAQRASAR